MKYDRAKFFSDLGLKKVHTSQLISAIEWRCPYSDEELKNKDRRREAVEWRGAICLLWWLQGLKQKYAAKNVNRNHDSLNYYFQCLESELFTGKHAMVKNIRLINYYAARMTKKCNETKFELICGKK